MLLVIVAIEGGPVRKEAAASLAVRMPGALHVVLRQTPWRREPLIARATNGVEIVLVFEQFVIPIERGRAVLAVEKHLSHLNHRRGTVTH